MQNDVAIGRLLYNECNNTSLPFERDTTVSILITSMLETEIDVKEKDYVLGVLWVKAKTSCFRVSVSLEKYVS